MKKSLADAEAGFEKAKADKATFERDYDTAAASEKTATESKKAAWTAAGLDPNDKSFNEGPAGKGGKGGDGSAAGQGGKGDQGGKGGSSDGKGDAAGGKGGKP